MGLADAKEEVKVEFAEQIKHTVADSSGNWMVLFNPVKAGGPFRLEIKGNNEITIKNILVGEVWVCSGQSNMEWPYEHHRIRQQHQMHYFRPGTT